MAKMFKNQGAKVVFPVNESFKTYRPHRDGEDNFEEYLKVRVYVCVYVWMWMCTSLCI